MWEAVIAQYEGVSFVYMAEEPGSEIFINTDTTGIYLPEKYLMEIYGDAPVPDGWYVNKDKSGCLNIREYFDNFGDLTDFCTELTGKEFNTLGELQTYFSELFDEEDNTTANIYEFTAE